MTCMQFISGRLVLLLPRPTMLFFQPPTSHRDCGTSSRARFRFTHNHEPLAPASLVFLHHHQLSSDTHYTLRTSLLSPSAPHLPFPTIASRNATHVIRLRLRGPALCDNLLNTRQDYNLEFALEATGVPSVVTKEQDSSRNRAKFRRALSG
jgi:hypothetical protein